MAASNLLYRPASYWDHADPVAAIVAGPLTEALRDLQEGSDPRGLVGFVTVESEFYPGLADYFEQRAAEWLERKLQ